MSEHTKLRDNADEPTFISLLASYSRNFADRIQLGSGLSSTHINEIEKLLDATLCDSLRCFLERYGWAYIGSEKLCGASEAQIMEQCSIVRASRVLSRNHERPLVVILNDGGSFMYALPIEVGKTIDRIMVLPIVGGDPDEGWPSGLSFGEFVEQLLSQVAD